MPLSKRQPSQLLTFNYDVEIIDDEHSLEVACERLMLDLTNIKLLGFDCEWITGDDGTQPISLLQLASSSGFCVLIRVHLLRELLPCLTKILQDKSIIKVGVACFNDAKKFHQDYGISIHGCVDLRHLALRILPTSITQGQPGGLANLASTCLGLILDKNPAIRSGNWESDQLNLSQTSYAATDALIALDITVALIDYKLNLHTTLPLKDNLDFWTNRSQIFHAIVDIPFIFKTKPSASTTPSSRSKKVKPSKCKYRTRDRPLYHNCQLRAPDGQLLCTCDTKKADWYVEKGLGKFISGDSEAKVVQLTFEPSGRPLSERNYYLQEKRNVCVVCGSEGPYVRKNVVPSEYRRHFPQLMKDHRSHDVVLMCLPCHQRSTFFDSELKAKFAQECCAPISHSNGEKSLRNDQRFRLDHSLTQVRSAAKALTRPSKAEIPEKRIQELRSIICKFYGVDETKDLDQSLLEEACLINNKTKNDLFSPHGEKVVRYVVEHEGLLNFEKMWRQHFIDSMKPEFMPDLWSIDHSHERLDSMQRDMSLTLKIKTK